MDPSLYNGFNLAILQSLGKSHDEIEILHTSAIGFARIFAYLLKISDILSIPAVLEMSIYCKISKPFPYSKLD